MRIVWHCQDRAGAAMAGPAIRAVQLAARLAAAHEVTLVCPGAAELAAVPFATAETTEGASIARHLAGADALVTQGFGFPARDLRALPPGAPLVLDLYNPVQLELLARFGPAPSAGDRLLLAFVRRRLLALLRRAEVVLCASERQRAFWLGWLGAAGRLNPRQLDGDADARRLLLQVPFGLEADGAPAPGGALVRACVGEDEQAILWWGGLWDWLDPGTAIRAVELLRREGKRVGLVLPAANRPGAAAMAASGRAEEEARARGLWGRGRGVCALPAWVPYAERRAILDGAAVAVSCHVPSLEAELAFRTRLLDCLWAGLPVVATEGDELSARAARDGWGRTVPPGDAAALAGALAALLAPEANARARAAAHAARPAASWDRSAEPLLRWLAAPRSSASSGGGRARRGASSRLGALAGGELDGAALGEVALAGVEKVLRRVRRLAKLAR